MGESLSAFIAYGAILKEPEWQDTNEEGTEGHTWPWDKAGEWWEEHNDHWLASLYGDVPRAQAHSVEYNEDYIAINYDALHALQEKIPVDLVTVSWGDEDQVYVVFIKESRIYTGGDDGFMPIEPDKLLDIRDIGELGKDKPAWREGLFEFMEKSGFKISPTWFVGYSYG